MTQPISELPSDPNAQASPSIPPRKAINRLAKPIFQEPVVIVRHQPPLSVTERRVLRLLARGLTERQAGEEMGRSHNTVHVHVRNIYRKLGISSRKMLYRLIDEQPELVADETSETPPRRQAA